jgi:protoporphyrinogen/coproporphyrinogen III oxidase
MSPAGSGAPAVAVVGSGIAGVAAALRLRDRLGPAARITVWETADRPGGKLHTGELAGLPTEWGADAVLFRDPLSGGDSAAVALARRLGLDLVHPEPVPPALLVDGSLQPLPDGTLLGVPGDLTAVAAVAAPDPDRDADAGRPLLGPDQDIAVGTLVRDRFGDAVADRLVEPMLGGVYAGRVDDLSLATTMPSLADACRRESTLTGAVRAALASSPRRAGGPVFAAVRGGMTRLVEAVITASGAQVRLGRPVRELARAGGRWRLVVGSSRDPEAVEADAVVLALPSRPAARLLRAEVPAAAGPVDVLDYASVGLVTLALPESVTLPERSGFLVPAVAGMTIKAVTFFGRKWAHLRADGGPVLVRASVGRYGDASVLRYTDDALVGRVHADLATVLDTALPAPLAWHVQRWGGALPQYAPGHRDRVADARAALPATLRLAGAGYDGVGIPACIRSGQTAADEVVEGLGESTV